MSIKTEETVRISNKIKYFYADRVEAVVQLCLCSVASPTSIVS